MENDPKSEDYLDEETLKRLKKEGNKVSFDEMGKIIGARWKNIDPDRLQRFSELAAEDAERYKKEMKSYNSRQEAKMRSEAVKPPPAYSRPGMEKGGPPPPGMDPRAQGYYPEMGSAFANPAMGYSPYGMDFYGGMGMYGPYGGYPPPPAMGGSPESMARYAQENPYAQGMYQQPPMMGMPPQYGYPGPEQGYPPQGYPPMDQYGQPPYPQGGWGGQ